MAEWDDGWERVTDGAPKGTASVWPRPILNTDEKSISGKGLMFRAEELDAGYTERDAEALFERRKSLPEDWADAIILFPGTVYRHPVLGDAIVSLYRTVSDEGGAKAKASDRAERGPRISWHLHLFLLDSQGRVPAFFGQLCFLRARS